jgi:nuclear transcription factor Y gamma
MISAEAPIVFAKACEIFILELTLRAWMHTDECKRRTLQRNDVAVAITRSDIFDFLIDIVPRDDSKLKKNEVRIFDTPNLTYFVCSILEVQVKIRHIIIPGIL